MEYKLYSIYDRLSHLYGNPFVQVNDACAVRYFQSLCAGSKDMPSGDYDLMIIGSWNPEIGAVLAQDPVLVKNGGEFGGN